MTLVDFLVFGGNGGGISLSASGAAVGGLLESDFRITVLSVFSYQFSAFQIKTQRDI